MTLDSDQQVILKMLRRLRAIEHCLEGKVLSTDDSRFEVDPDTRVKISYLDPRKEEMVDEEF